jgi:hypothetical protein
MPTCAQGHDSVDEEFCDVCGLAFDQPAPVAAPEEPSSAPDAPTVVRPCPVCGAPLEGRFCESCGADSLATPPPEPLDAPEPSAPAEPLASDGSPAGGEVAGATWSVVVSADRRYFDSVKAAGGPDADPIAFPPFCPDRSFALRGEQVTIGRRSQTRGILPDIDLTGPPEDIGVSRLHALLVAGSHGWSVVDMNSANGTYLNESSDPLAANTPTPLTSGDRIHLGAWTTLTLHTL